MTNSPLSNGFLHPTHCVVPMAFLSGEIQRAVERAIANIMAGAPIKAGPVEGLPTPPLPDDEDEDEVEDPLSPQVRGGGPFGVPRGFRPMGRLKPKEQGLKEKIE